MILIFQRISKMNPTLQPNGKSEESTCALFDCVPQVNHRLAYARNPWKQDHTTGSGGLPLYFSQTCGHNPLKQNSHVHQINSQSHPLLTGCHAVVSGFSRGMCTFLSCSPR